MSLAVRLLPEEELADDPQPERCVELEIQRRQDDTITVSSLRITPADLVRLATDVELTLSEIRTEVLRVELAWRDVLGRWHEEGGAAVESAAPDVALLARVLEALRRDDLVPA